MIIGGFLKFTLLDYPGKIAAVVFTMGCPLRCPFCHNPELVESKNPKIKEDDIFKFLKKRSKQLEGVVISGGEPTIQKNLPLFIRKVKDMNLAVKLDTSGVNPDVLENLFKLDLLDYISMDIKAPFEKYSKAVGRDIDIDKIKKSINLIVSSNIPYQFRTTLVLGIHELEDILKISEMIRGAKRFTLQEFVPTKTLDPAFKNREAFPRLFLEKIKREVERRVEVFDIY